MTDKIFISKKNSMIYYTIVEINRLKNMLTLESSDGKIHYVIPYISVSNYYEGEIYVG